MNLVTSAAGTVASYSPVKIPDIYPVKVARRSLFGDDIHDIRVKTVNNHDEGLGFSNPDLILYHNLFRINFKHHFSELGSLIRDKEFIFKVKNLGELKQRLRRNLKLEEPIRFFYCQK